MTLAIKTTVKFPEHIAQKRQVNDIYEVLWTELLDKHFNFGNRVL